MSRLDKATDISAQDEGSFVGRFIKVPGQDWVQVVGVVEEEDLEIPEDGMIEQNGNLYCYACGDLAAPGEEEFDFCDHKTGRGCSHMSMSSMSDEWEY
jgi:hypothetical protein